MKLLKTIRDSDFSFEGEYGEMKNNRQASRAVVFDGENNIAILKVSKLNYHKLPGGGVEGSEDLIDALRREVLEEIGCEISVLGELGEITEYRGKFDLKQDSFCYLAKLEGEKGRPNYTEEEIRDGFQIVWVSLDKAIEILKNDQPINYEGKFIQMRDLCFLEEAKNNL
jgi:ADP-ribose pyrophosphatase YjhB (NUDIX family)